MIFITLDEFFLIASAFLLLPFTFYLLTCAFLRKLATKLAKLYKTPLIILGK
ncbi:hypothetical protein NUACC26_057340 [Scytonema sp. NUACC26]